MTVSQDIYHVQDQEYDDTITVTDIPKGYFIAVTANSVSEGSSTREIRVDLMAAEWAAGGKSSVGTNIFIRKSGENAICVKVYNGSTLECENTISYS